MAEESGARDRLPVPDADTLTALGRTASALERRAGGRARLVDVLLPAITTRDHEALVGLLDDPRNAARPIEALLVEARIPFAALRRLYADAQLLEAQTQVREAVARELPAVAADVLARAVEHKRPCLTCEGTGTLVANPSETNPNPSPTPCGVCGGFGLVIWQPGERNQKLALELGGLLQRGPGVSINVQQKVAVVGDLVSESVDAITRATDRALYGDQRARSTRRSPAEVIDATSGRVGDADESTRG